MAEEARINSVIWKGYRMEIDETVKMAPDDDLDYSAISQISGHSIRSIALQNLTRVAENYKHQGRLADAANAYRKVITGYKKADGDFAGPLLRASRSLSIILKAQRNYDEAEEILIYAFGLCLMKADLDPPYAMSLATILGHPLPTHTVDIVVSLEDMYTEQSDFEIKLSLAELRKALRLWNGGGLAFQYPHIWFAITRLARSYSESERIASAQILYGLAIMNVKTFDDILYATKKANGYLGYSLHLQRQRLWDKSGRMLMLALEVVTQVGDQGMIPKDDYEPLVHLVTAHWMDCCRNCKIGM